MLVKFCNLSFSDACEVLKAAQSTEDTDDEARKILEHLDFDFGCDFDPKDEEGILFYFVGFLARGAYSTEAGVVRAYNVALRGNGMDVVAS